MTIEPSPFLPYPTCTAEHLADLAAKLKALSEVPRLQILSLLTEHGPMAVSELMPPLGLSKSTVVHHLASLAAAGMVRTTTIGGQEFRAVDVDAVAAVAVRIDPYGPRDHERRSSSGAEAVRQRAAHSGTVAPHSAEVSR